MFTPYQFTDEDYPPDDDYSILPPCDACCQLPCACAKTVADIDAWADAYLGSTAHALDYRDARERTQQYLAKMYVWPWESPRPPDLLDDAEQVE